MTEEQFRAAMKRFTESVAEECSNSLCWVGNVRDSGFQADGDVEFEAALREFAGAVESGKGKR